MSDPYAALGRPVESYDAISKPVSSRLAAPKTAPATPRHTFLGDFGGTVSGSLNKLKADAAAYYKDTTKPVTLREAVTQNPLKGEMQLAGLAGDALGLLASPIAGLQHATLRPVSEAVSKRIPYTDYGSLTDQARQLLAGRVPKMIKYGSQESARKLEADLTAAVSSGMPARGAVGLAGPRIPPRLPKAPSPPLKPTPQQVLKDAGVFMTPGVRAGGLAKNVEDLAQRAPILGPAIRGARQRSGESLNRAVANRALAPLNEVVPPKIKTGHDSVSYVADRLGKVYDDAADLVPQVALDMPFAQNLQTIAIRARELPTDVDRQLTNILSNRLAPLQNGPVTGRELRAVQSDIGKLAAEHSAMDDGAQQQLGHILEGVSDELKGVLSRANPQAGQMIDTANEGWANYVRLRSAASKAAKGGIFTPGQLATAVRVSDKSVGKGNVAKGQALMQDLSSAASEVLPDGFGNPGTADAVGLGALGTGLVTAPAQTIPIAAGLGAAATPYMLMGRKVVTSLPASPTAAQIQQANATLSQLSKMDPKIIVLQQYLAQLHGRQLPAPTLATEAAAQEEQPQ